MPLSTSALRQDIYRLLDAVLETGEPLEIERRGRILRIVAESPSDKLSRLAPDPEFVRGRADTLVQAGWDSYWDGEPELDLPVEC